MSSFTGRHLLDFLSRRNFFVDYCYCPLLLLLFPFITTAHHWYCGLFWLPSVNFVVYCCYLQLLTRCWKDIYYWARCLAKEEFSDESLVAGWLPLVVTVNDQGIKNFLYVLGRVLSVTKIPGVSRRWKMPHMTLCVPVAGSKTNWLQEQRRHHWSCHHRWLAGPWLPSCSLYTWTESL
jgi:hypothetical protein